MSVLPEKLHIISVGGGGDGGGGGGWVVGCSPLASPARTLMIVYSIVREARC